MQNLRYPKTINKSVWGSYLGRELTKKEISKLEGVRSEYRLNKMMDKLYKHCKTKKLYICELTDNDGDCLFSSLVYHGIGKTVKTLRKGLSIIMYQLRNEKYLFNRDDANDDRTLKELVELQIADIGIVCSSNKELSKEGKKKFYKYGYNAMCEDLSNEGSWSRLPGETILHLISLLYNVEIITISDVSDYEIHINARDNKEAEKIYLGLINDYHYFPLDKLEADEELEPIYYKKKYKRFKKWAEKREADKVREYILSEIGNSDEEKEEYVNIEPSKIINFK